MNDLYTKELKKILSDTTAARPAELTRPEIEAAIVDISSQLRGHLSNMDRLWLVADRLSLRKQLAALPSTNATPERQEGT